MVHPNFLHTVVASKRVNFADKSITTIGSCNGQFSYVRFILNNRRVITAHFSRQISSLQTYPVRMVWGVHCALQGLLSML